MEDDSDTEMACAQADFGTDFSDDVDRNFDAKARPQQGSTVEIRSRRADRMISVPGWATGRFRLPLVTLRSRGRQMTAACSLSLDPE